MTSAIHELNDVTSTTSENDPRRPQLEAIATALDGTLRNMKDAQINLLTIRRELERDDYHYTTLNDAISLCNDAIDKLESRDI